MSVTPAGATPVEVSPRSHARGPLIAAPLLRQASAFRLGEGLVAGRIAAHPLRFQGARRWTREGGADVPATWAQPASHAPGTATDHPFVPQAPPTADHDSPR